MLRGGRAPTILRLLLVRFLFMREGQLDIELRLQRSHPVEPEH